MTLAIVDVADNGDGTLGMIFNTTVNAALVDGTKCKIDGVPAASNFVDQVTPNTIDIDGDGAWPVSLSGHNWNVVSGFYPGLAPDGGSVP